MQEIYKKVAETFARRITEVFASEDSLKQEFEKNLPHLEFTRTDHWQLILLNVLRECWFLDGPEVKSEPTGYDRIVILRELYHFLDYNLFTQVLLNLQTYIGMAYMTTDAEKEMEKLKESWPKEAKLNPFEPKAKMVKQASSEEEKQHNNILSTLKSLKIISQFTPQISFRVSACGQTPSFADSRNISMIGIGGDRFLQTLPNLKAFYIHWEPGSNPDLAKHSTNANAVDGNVGFEAEGIPYPFFSKSGGEILQEVLFARKIMAEVFAAHDTTAGICILIPRKNSVLVVTEEHGHHLKKAFESVKKQYPMLELSEGARG